MTNNGDKKSTNSIVVMLATALFVQIIIYYIFIKSQAVFDAIKGKGEIGDFIGGSASPIIGAIGAWLVYKSFKAQLFANEMQINSLRIEREERQKEIAIIEKANMIAKKEEEIRLKIENLNSSLDRFVYVKPIYQSSIGKDYQGIQALYRFCKDIGTSADELAYQDNEILIEQIKNWLFQVLDFAYYIKDNKDFNRHATVIHYFMSYDQVIEKCFDNARKRTNGSDKLLEELSEIGAILKDVETGIMLARGN